MGDKMKIYDTHSDIMHNLYERSIKGEKNVFEKYHLHDLNEGGVVGGIWVVYGDKDFDLRKAYDIALEEYKPFEKQYNVIYGLEGLRNVKDVEDLDYYYKLGIRHASLTWNEENHFATGVAGEKDKGLKEEGKKIIKYMNDHNMIIDVSHLNIKSFYDVLEENPKILIASHSNAYTISNHRRNLNDDQLKALKELGAYVGVNSARNFVSYNKEKQNLDGLIDQMIYLADKIGIDHVMLGLDMMHFLGDYSNANLDDLTCHKDASNLEKSMLLRGFNEKEIEMIGSLNYLNVIKNVKRSGE